MGDIGQAFEIYAGFCLRLSNFSDRDTLCISSILRHNGFRMWRLMKDDVDIPIVYGYLDVGLVGVYLESEV